MIQTVEPIVYQGQFGDFIVDAHDRREVVIYRAGLTVAATSFAIATGLILWQGAAILPWISVLYSLFCLGLGVSLWMIHIYLKPLHRALQLFWAIGVVASGAIALLNPAPLAQVVYAHPLTLFGVGFVFAALTGVFFKEGFCFDRLETKVLTPLVPVLLLGHLVGWLPLQVEQGLLITWAGFFLIFAARKLVQPIPQDIGDKSVFEHLKQQELASKN
jgi:uncharacterized integral membrane protein